VFTVRRADEHDDDEFAVKDVWLDVVDIVVYTMATYCGRNDWRS
jgi:hypothetical protein